MRDPVTIDVVATQNADFDRLFALAENANDPPNTFVNITGWKFSAEVQTKEGSGGKKLATITAAITNAVNGQYRLTLGRAYTAAITQVTNYYSVMLLTPLGKYICIQKGKFTVNPQATQTLPA